MLTCIARSKKPSAAVAAATADPGAKNASVKSLTSQLKDMALKASGAYRSCGPCGGPGAASGRMKGHVESDAESDRFYWSYRRQGSSGSNSSYNAGQRFVWGKGENSSGDVTPSSGTGSRRKETAVAVFVEEKEPKEWVAQVEPGVLIDFLSLPGGGNYLRRVRFRKVQKWELIDDVGGFILERLGNMSFDCVLAKLFHSALSPCRGSRDMFNKFQAQKWWTENYDRVMELYNVQRLNRQAFPLLITPRSEDEGLKIESMHDSPVTPPVDRERPPRNLQCPTGLGMGYSSSDSLDHLPGQPHVYHDSIGVASTPTLSSIRRPKTETSSMETSIRSSSSRNADRSSEMSISTASDFETERVEQDEPGVYITIRALPGGKRELRRVRFSRERFGEVHARLWWEENRARIHGQYL